MFKALVDQEEVSYGETIASSPEKRDASTVKGLSKALPQCVPIKMTGGSYKKPRKKKAKGVWEVARSLFSLPEKVQVC